MKALVLYDLTGKIWNIIYGAEEVPQGMPSIFVDIPENAQLERIDLTDPKNPQPVFNYLPDTDFGRTDKRISELESKLSDAQEVITEQYEKSKALEAEITNLQLAITSIYEGSEIV